MMSSARQPPAHERLVEVEGPVWAAQDQAGPQRDTLPPAGPRKSDRSVITMIQRPDRAPHCVRTATPPTASIPDAEPASPERGSTRTNRARAATHLGRAGVAPQDSGLRVSAVARKPRSVGARRLSARPAGNLGANLQAIAAVTARGTGSAQGRPPYQGIRGISSYYLPLRSHSQ